MDFQKLNGVILALTAVFLWSLNILIAGHFAAELTPIEFAFGRWVFALAILLPIGGMGVWKYKRYLLERWKWVLSLAVSGVVLENTLIYIAAHTVGTTDLSLLNLLGPLFLTLLSAFLLKQKLTFRQTSGLIITVAGVVLIITHGQVMRLEDFPMKVGDFWMILNSLCFAVYSFLQLKRPDFISQTVLLTVTVMVGVILLLPPFIIRGSHQLHHLTGTDYLIFIYLGIFNSVLAYLAWNSALAKIGPVKTGVIFYLQPVFSITAGYLIFGTSILPVQILGGLIVLAGILLVNHTKTVISTQK